ncbi:unnamed protein product [Closterium sp. NIES-64]|nr:unnamed protein product [Closterium sp. NIES-64]
MKQFARIVHHSNRTRHPSARLHCRCSPLATRRPSAHPRPCSNHPLRLLPPSPFRGISRRLEGSSGWHVSKAARQKRAPQRKSSSKRGAGSRRAGSRAAAPASSMVLSFNPPSPRPLCISAPPPPAPPLLQLSAKSFASFSLASQVLSVDLGSASFLSFHSVKSHRWLGHDLQATDLPFLIPALRVCLAGGGEGCGVSTAIPSRLSPAAVQRGTHTGRLGGGLPGKESPGAAAAALCSLSLTAKFPQPLACLAMSCASVQVPPQVQPLGLQFVTWPPPVAPPLSRLANAVPSLALSPFIPSLATDQLCVCALQVEGRGGGQHRRFPTPLPRGRAGTRGDGREAALPIAAPRESIGSEGGREHWSKGDTEAFLL